MHLTSFIADEIVFIILKASLKRGRHMHEQFVREQEVQERIDRVHHTANGPMTLTYTRIGRLKYDKNLEDFETDRSKMGHYFP